MRNLNIYQQEQLETLLAVRDYLLRLAPRELQRLTDKISPYLSFRNDVSVFSNAHFADVCNEKCYRERLSACCSRDGIIVFFADVVINALVSSDKDLDRLEEAICHPETEFKCIFLSDSGCLWRVKPIVCEMFICDEAKKKVFDDNPAAAGQWEQFEAIREGFTWPDQPVLFEYLEDFFMKAGCQSPLMHIHTSPGLMRVRRARKK